MPKLKGTLPPTKVKPPKKRKTKKEIEAEKIAKYDADKARDLNYV
jgi:hypothetical protein